MEMKETILYIENNRVNLLQRLRTIMVAHPISFGDLCKKIDIQRNTLKSFINGKGISLRTFKKIEKYVKGKE
jgi:hypothetical protein